MTREAQGSGVELILIGGGEHARVALDASLSLAGDWHVTGYVDPERHPDLERAGLAWLGDDAEAQPMLRGKHCVIAVGGAAGSMGRRRIQQLYADSGVAWARVVHPSAVVASDVVVGEGVMILAGAVVNPGATIGEHAIVNSGVVIEHDVDVGSFVHIAPGSVVGGGATIAEGAFIGLGARVRDHVRIGANATVGMGAVVVQDVPDRETWLGVPARRGDANDQPMPVANGATSDV